MTNPHQTPAGPKAEAEPSESAQPAPCAPSPQPESASQAEPAPRPEPPPQPGAQPEAGQTPEPPSEAAAAEPGAAEPGAAEVDSATEIAQLKEQAEKMRDQMLRALAEAENTRRRAERDRQDLAKYAITDFARDLLSTADNLRRALEAVPADAIGQDAVLSNLTDGVAATERELVGALEKFGVKMIDSLDQKFDPNFHQAMFEVPDTGKPPGTIAQVVQEGYMIHDRLLRPALVGVAKGEPAQQVDTTA